MKNKLLVLTFLCFQLCIYAQEDAWVYLTDKENVATSIANPISILTQKAIDRKAAHSIGIDERDVPVNENYISQLKNQSGITVLAKSKWFNAVHVRGLETDINVVSTLPFVDVIIFADNNLNAKGASVETIVNKFELESVSTTFNYGDAANQIEMFNGDDLHLANYTGSGKTVAVIDAGFPSVDTNPGFDRVRNAGNILGTYDFVNRDTDVYTNTTSNHGTLVFSDMAGYVENTFVGTAPDASYYLFISENAPTENPIEESLWVEAAERADSLGVDVINTSLGYKTYDNPNYSHTNADLDGNTTYITKGANIAFEKGMLLVTSAGNSGANGIAAPADAAGVFTIGAVKADGTYASFSSVGSTFQPTLKPDVVAQGQASYVINESGGLSTANGTSFSSPILAGGLVCLWEALPNLTNAEIMQLVRESASQYTTPDYFLGYGIPDLSLALQTGLSVEEVTFNTSKIQVYPNPAKHTVFVKLPTEIKKAQIKLYSVLGRKVLDAKINTTQSKLNVEQFSKGMYLLKIEAETYSKTIKLIIN
ncbi:S8 family serine peptidase [Bizionia saleffrena]|uniref:S8 family serine peptidase n=1 Tax=Bizionia saleffrena TaxID=291189 RepID=A0A8H2LJD1_9FLAO|nr:S8 family serine peptidase [Bizionia saleffrena]TYB80196.1 S8 family serine peptidase [Bizionia saleffrena]